MIIDSTDRDALCGVTQFYNIGVRFNGITYNILNPESLIKLSEMHSVELVCTIIRNALNSKHKNDERLVRNNDIVDLCKMHCWAGDPTRWHFWQYTKSGHVEW